MLQPDVAASEPQGAAEESVDVAFWARSSRSLRSLLLEVAAENMQLRLDAGTAVADGQLELRQSPDGNVELLVDGRRWERLPSRHRSNRCSHGASADS